METQKFLSRNPETVHAPVAGYAHQIEVRGNVRWLVLSGQLGQHRDGTLSEDPAEQLAAALENLRLNLNAAGMTIEDIVKVTFYLVGTFDAARRRTLVADWFGTHRPCMTLLYVSALAAPQYRVEVDAWACRSVEG